VTVRVTTLKGLGAGRYYTEQLPSYYLDAGEPSGRWFGRGATTLGFDGVVEDEAFLAVMAGLDPATGRDLGRRYGDESVRGFDATFSAPKSVSVLFALGDEELRRRVTEAHDRAVEAVLGWVEARAHTRLRRRGHVVCVDAEGIVVGVFRQHTSRRLDPQLHTHAVIANRVRAPDGRWLALDARTIKIDQRTLSALYHASLRSELTRRVGVAWHQPVNGIAEMTGIDP
jgi:conjugative relaxase-like TrwC/TraI family protein